MEKRYVKYYQFPLGRMKLTSTDSVLLSVRWDDDDDDSEATRSRPILEQTMEQLDEYFAGERKVFSLSIEPRGTAFQQKVWRVLRTIPYGQIWSYQDVADAIENPRSARAVGRANNKNPLVIIIPCHRVIGSNGLLTGYAGGVDTKKALLDMEKKQLIKDLNLLLF